MTAANHDSPVSAADGQHIAFTEAVKGHWHRRHNIAEAFEFRPHPLQIILRHPGRDIKRVCRPRNTAEVRRGKGSGVVVLAKTHIQRRPPLVTQPARLTDVVRVHVRDDDAQYRLALHRAIEQLLPGLLCTVQAHAGVDNPPAIAVFKYVKVDVIQGHGQRHAQPVNALSYRNPFANFWSIFKGVLNISHAIP